MGNKTAWRVKWGNKTAWRGKGEIGQLGGKLGIRLLGGKTGNKTAWRENGNRQFEGHWGSLSHKIIQNYID